MTVVTNEEGGNSVATVVLRGSTDSILDDLERAVDDGVNTYKVIWSLCCLLLLLLFFPFSNAKFMHLFFIINLCVFGCMIRSPFV